MQHDYKPLARSVEAMFSSVTVASTTAGSSPEALSYFFSKLTETPPKLAEALQEK
jgi:hypothetical protein